MFRYTNFEMNLFLLQLQTQEQNCYKTKAQLIRRKLTDAFAYQGWRDHAWRVGRMSTGIPLQKPGISFGGLLRGNYQKYQHHLNTTLSLDQDFSNKLPGGLLKMQIVIQQNLVDSPESGWTSASGISNFPLMSILMMTILETINLSFGCTTPFPGKLVNIFLPWPSLQTSETCICQRTIQVLRTTAALGQR